MIVKGLDAEFVIDESLIEESEKEVRRQAEEFLEGQRESFNLNFSFPSGGLGFVLRKINKVPYGDTRTYSDIADETNSAAISIGQYCGKNPLPLIIPCHRVVGKNDLGGYKSGKDVKKRLLKLEGADF